MHAAFTESNWVGFSLVFERLPAVGKQGCGRKNTYARAMPLTCTRRKELNRIQPKTKENLLCPPNIKLNAGLSTQIRLGGSTRAAAHPTRAIDTGGKKVTGALGGHGLGGRHAPQNPPHPGPAIQGGGFSVKPRSLGSAHLAAKEGKGGEPRSKGGPSQAGRAATGGGVVVVVVVVGRLMVRPLASAAAPPLPVANFPGPWESTLGQRRAAFTPESPTRTRRSPRSVALGRRRCRLR